jgi:hypothetical protein
MHNKVVMHDTKQTQALEPVLIPDLMNDIEAGTIIQTTKENPTNQGLETVHLEIERIKDHIAVFKCYQYRAMRMSFIQTIINALFCAAIINIYCKVYGYTTF